MLLDCYAISVNFATELLVPVAQSDADALRRTQLLLQIHALSDDRLLTLLSRFNTTLRPVHNPRAQHGHITELFLRLRYGRGVLQSAGLYVREHISKTTRPNFTEFSVPVVCDRALVLHLQCCDMSCSSRSVDDITFAHNGQA